jgi:hypothetical protein
MGRSVIPRTPAIDIGDITHYAGTELLAAAHFSKGREVIFCRFFGSLGLIVSGYTPVFRNRSIKSGLARFRIGDINDKILFRFYCL